MRIRNIQVVDSVAAIVDSVPKHFVFYFKCVTSRLIHRTLALPSFIVENPNSLLYKNDA